MYAIFSQFKKKLKSQNLLKNFIRKGLSLNKTISI